MNIRDDALRIIDAAIRAALPDTAIRNAIKELPQYNGKLILVAIGKAAWQMAATADTVLGNKIDKGIVITKHGHSMGAIGSFEICEAGHPVPDKDTYVATQKAINLVGELTKDDMVLFLISGGGSALFEKPLVPVEEMGDITHQLLACGADIVEMNTIRKRLSAVKGGKFAEICSPAKVFSVVLSDIIGDPLDMIASGPAYPDSSTNKQAKEIINKYNIKLSDAAAALMNYETPKELGNVETHVTGSVKQLCISAEKEADKLGYKPIILSTSLCCEAREAGSFIASVAQYYVKMGKSTAIIAGGETVVHLTGKGKGGRNQELALGAVKGIAGMENTLIFSVGSDGTDGPTDAAGGIVDGNTYEKLKKCGINIDTVMVRNDAYNALKAVDGLIFTGPTGTNVNDLVCLLIKGEK